MNTILLAALLLSPSPSGPRGMHPGPYQWNVVVVPQVRCWIVEWHPTRGGAEYIGVLQRVGPFEYVEFWMSEDRKVRETRWTLLPTGTMVTSGGDTLMPAVAHGARLAAEKGARER